MPSRFDDLKRLEKMFADELITREEFSKLKDELLSEAPESAEPSEFSKLKDELLSEAPESAETSEVGPPSVEPDTTWNREEEKQFISNLESRMSPDAVRDLGRHLNRVQLKGIARMNRDPYVLLYVLGRGSVDLQRSIDNALPDEKRDMAELFIKLFMSEFREQMKRPPDDDTPIKWYADVAMAIWKAANAGENG